MNTFTLILLCGIVGVLIGDAVAYQDNGVNGRNIRAGGGWTKCRCSLRNAPPAIMNSCADRVYATNTAGDIGRCQDDAKKTASQQCRQYYGHCSFIPN